MPPKPSYRRNRDYSTHFNWTYDLKRDVYRCYLMAKEDPRIGYMKRLKEKRDEIHPEYSFLSDKNLRDQASRIEKNKDVMDTDMYILDQIITQKLMNKPTTVIIVLKLSITHTLVAMKNHNLLLNH